VDEKERRAFDEAQKRRADEFEAAKRRILGNTSSGIGTSSVSKSPAGHEFKAQGGDLYIDGQKVLKAFESYSGWYWFATEDTGKRYNNLPMWYGLVQGEEEEWGYFAEGELKELGNRVWAIKPQDLPFAGRRARKESMPTKLYPTPTKLPAEPTAKGHLFAVVEVISGVLESVQVFTTRPAAEAYTGQAMTQYGKKFDGGPESWTSDDGDDDIYLWEVALVE